MDPSKNPPLTHVGGSIASPPERRASSLASIEPINILLVDDSPQNLLALEVVLSSPDYNLVKATSGKDALRYLLDHDCAIIILDVQMPDMDGYETASLIKQSERYRDIPIIFVTALNKDERFVQKGYESGAVDYLFKPFDDTILRSKVAVFADLFRKTEEIRRQAKLLRESERRERAQELARLELRSLKRNQADQQKYRDLVDGIHHGIIWAADGDTQRCTFVSQSAEAILGYPSQQWMTDPRFWQNHLHPEDRGRVLKLLAGIAPGSREQRFEHRLMNVAGEARWFQTGIRVAEKSEGEGYELRALSIDITKIKEAELVLKQEEKRARLLAETARSVSRSLELAPMLDGLGKLALGDFSDFYAIFAVNEKTHEIEPLAAARPEAGAATGLTPGSPTTPARDAAWARDPEGAVARVIRTGLAELHPDVGADFLGPNSRAPENAGVASPAPIHSAVIAPLAARGRVFGAITFALTQPDRRYDRRDFATGQDLASQIATGIDNARLFQAAQEAIETRNEFLSIASHELKTPLTPLKLQMQSLLRMLARQECPAADIQRIQKLLASSDVQINKISKLIDELLDVSRISAGKLSLDRERCDLVELFGDVLERFSNHLEAAGCQVNLAGDPTAVGLWDKFRLEQVLVNLLTNAIKYGPGKPIEISIRADESITFAIQDHGLGIARIDQDRIFQRFERAASSRHFGGLGLGLYIVSQILAAHAGTIAVESEPGKGSRFIVTLPRTVG